MNQPVYIYDAVRTPRGVGKKTGALHEVKPIDLLTTALDALDARNHLEKKHVEDIVIGCVTPIDEQGANLGKAASLYGGWNAQTSGMQLNRFCASGLEAINVVAAKIAAGWESCGIAGGVESMSRVPMGGDGGALMFDPAVTAKVNYIPQGISADLLATLCGYSRADVDAFALRSHQRAHEAWLENRFAKSVVPVKDQNGLTILDRDETVRPGTTIERLGGLKSAFAELGTQGFDVMALLKYPHLERIAHVHTAGNSSQICDGAALVLLGNAELGQKLGIKPRARIVMGASSGDEPTVMFKGIVPSTRKALQLAGMQLSDVQLWEANEAFASVVLNFGEQLGIDLDRINVNGGAIGLGHPLGATGAILMATLLDELERQDLAVGGLTLCTGGGMGVTTIIERV